MHPVFLRAGIGLLLITLVVCTGAASAVNTSHTTPVGPLSIQGIFIPGGFIGDTHDIVLDEKYADKGDLSGNTPGICTKITYSGAASDGLRWAGVYWLYPDGNWGQKKGYNLTGYKTVSFRARGEKGGEVAEFKVGGISTDGKLFVDSINPVVTTGNFDLEKGWKNYTLDLSDRDRSAVIGGFCWVTNLDRSPRGCTIYLDDIRYEK